MGNSGEIRGKSVTICFPILYSNNQKAQARRHNCQACQKGLESVAAFEVWKPIVFEAHLTMWPVIVNNYSKKSKKKKKIKKSTIWVAVVAQLGWLIWWNVIILSTVGQNAEEAALSGRRERFGLPA